jgi:hypothetical protein
VTEHQNKNVIRNYPTIIFLEDVSQQLKYEFAYKAWLI